MNFGCPKTAEALVVLFGRSLEIDPDGNDNRGPYP